MSKEIQIPDYLKEMISEGSVESGTSAMDTGMNGGPRISTRGKVFRFRDGDSEEKHGQEIDVVIIGINPARGLSHTFYAEGYSPDSSDPPDCSSMNGVTPDSWISSPKSDTCARCSNQVWGSAKSMTGKKAKACKDSKQLYIARAEEFSKDAENCKLWLISVTVNSLKSLSNYGKLLASKGIPGPQFCVTKLYFNEDESVPKLEFKLIGILGEKHGPIAHKRFTDKEWDTQSTLFLEHSSESKYALPSDSRKSEAPDNDDFGEGPDVSVSVDDLLGNWD